MMNVEIRSERPVGSEISALIEERLAHSYATLPPESVHSFDLSQLHQPNIHFWTARVDGNLAGCGALQIQQDGNGEIKSMFVRPAWRGRGLSRRLLQEIEKQASITGLQQLYLETGTDSLAARSLYESFGYAYCGPFDPYKPDPLSVFMTKVLATRQV